MERADTGQKKYHFLEGGGEMGELIRNYNWSSTSVGSIDTWPVSLRTSVGLMLSSKFPMLIFWSNDLITFYNDAFRPSLGNDGKHPSSLGQRGEISWEESWPVIGPMIYNIMKGGEAVWFEDQKLPIYREGKMDYAYWTYSFSAIRNDKEDIGGLLVTCSETTKAVESLQALGESRELLSLAVEVAELGTFDLDPATGRFFANQQLRDWFGLSPTDEIELNVAMDVIHQDDRERVSAAVQQSFEFESGGKYEIDYTIVHPVTGKHTIVQAKGQTRFNEAQEPVRFTGTLRDVTQQAMYNQAIRADIAAQVTARKKIEEAEAALLSAIELAELATWSIDLATNRVTYSLRLQDWLGVEESVLETSGSTRVIEEDRERIRKAMADAVSENGSGRFDEIYTIVHKTSGQKRIIHANGIAVFDANGKCLSISGTARDVTEVRERQAALEIEVQNRTQELAAAVEELKTTNEDLSQVNNLLSRSNEELAQYAYVASHDLQEPLRKIRIFSSRLLEQEQFSPEVNGLMQKIQKSADRMSLLINDLLDFSQLLKSDSLVHKVNLNQVLEEVKSDFELLITEKSATIVINPLPVIEGVGLQMNQLFYNLVGNALKFARDTTRPLITISSRPATDKEIKDHLEATIPDTQYFAITVEDNGIGFEPRYVEQIFEVFKRLHGRTEYAGSGIGLALCRRIVNNHQGQLYASSEVDKGSTFYILLPQRQEAHEPSLPKDFVWTT